MQEIGFVQSPAPQTQQWKMPPYTFRCIHRALGGGMTARRRSPDNLLFVSETGRSDALLGSVVPAKGHLIPSRARPLDKVV